MLRFLQQQLRKLWTDEHYSEEFKVRKSPYKDFDHALKHIRKAAQELENMTEEVDHSGSLSVFEASSLQKYIADILISAVRLANVTPLGVVDLEGTVLQRIERKMGVRLVPSDGPAPAPRGKTLQECQDEVNIWISKHADGYWDPHQIYTRLGSEVGELGKEINHEFGPLPKKDGEKESSVIEESGDIVFTVICLLNSRGLSLEKAFEIAMSKCYGRDKDRFALRDSGKQP